MQQKHNDEKAILRSKLIYKYVEAMDQGDIDGVAYVLDEALNDLELDRIIAEINRDYVQEMEFPSFEADAQVVKSLIGLHLPSISRANETTQRSLSVADVATRLRADHDVPADDEESNLVLMSNPTILPNKLSMKAIHQLAQELGISASERFWRVFKSTAMKLSMGNNHNQVQFAAAREARTSYTTHSQLQQKTSHEGKSELDGEE